MDRILPSASQMYRLANCPGSYSLMRQLDTEGKLREEPSVDATIGQRIHAALEGEPEYLNSNEEELKEDCERLAGLVVRQVFDGERLDTEIHFEERLFYKVGDTPYFTGAPDRVYISASGVACNINFKTGRRSVGSPETNLQLRTEVYLIAHVYGCTRIATAIVQPLVTKHPEIVIYGESDIRRAEDEILGIVDKSLWSEDRKAGEWCYYCPARAYCPESRSYALIRQPCASDPSVRVLPTGEDAARLLEQVDTGYQILDAIWDHYKELVRNNLDIVPGWHISNGKEVRYVKDVAGAADKSSKSLIEWHMSVVKLEEHMKKVWKMNGGKFDQRFDQEFSAVIGTKKTQGSLERIPKRLLGKSSTDEPEKS